MINQIAKDAEMSKGISLAHVDSMLSQDVLCKRESLGTIGKRLFSGEGEGKYRSRNEQKRDRSGV